MLLLILFSVSLNVFAVNSQDGTWTGSTKNLIDKINISMEDIKSITQTMFENMKQNCGKNLDVPDKFDFPKPYFPCDLEIYPHLKNSMKDTTSFDSGRFLKKLWLSKVGGALLKSITKKGVSEYMVKAAMEELWFTKSDEADTPFNRLFFGKDDVANNANRKFSSWYTFSIHQEAHKNCKIELVGESVPLVVTGKCENDPYTSWFIYPNHPFVDMVIYSLCAWRNDYDDIYYSSQQCPVFVPGSSKLFAVETSIYANNDDSRYLSHVESNYDLYRDKQ